MEPTVRSVGHVGRDAGDDCLIDGFCETGRAEIVSAFSTPLPMALIAHIPKLKAWSDSFFTALSGFVGEEVVRAANNTLDFENFILDSIAARRATPVDDFLGRLIAPPNEEEQLSDAEIVNICSQVLVGGNESTTNLLGNLVHLTATTPGLQAILLNEPDKKKAAKACPQLAIKIAG